MPEHTQAPVRRRRRTARITAVLLVLGALAAAREAGARLQPPAVEAPAVSRTDSSAHSATAPGVTTPVTPGEKPNNTKAEDKNESGSVFHDVLGRNPAVAYVLLALVVVAAGVAVARGQEIDVLGLLKFGARKAPAADATRPDGVNPGDARALVQLTINNGAVEGGIPVPETAAAAPSRAPGDTAASSMAGTGGAAHRAAVEVTAAALAVSATAEPAARPDAPLYWRRARPLYEAFNARQRYGMRSFRWTLEITEDFDVASETVREIVAVDRPLVAICGSRGSNVPCPRFEDLRLEMYEGPEHARRPLLWLPTTDEPTSKQFVVFLREPLLPGGESVLLTLRSVWPRAAERLARGDDPDLQHFVLPKMAHGGIPAPDLRIKLPASRGRFRVTCVDPDLDVTVPDPATGATAVPVVVGPSQPGREIRCMVIRLPDTPGAIPASGLQSRPPAGVA